jgi:hypothetical protein
MEANLMKLTTDPRGIMRTRTKVERTPEVTLITYDCGHVEGHAQHFHYKVGGSGFCFQCGVEARAAKANEWIDPLNRG